MLTIERPTQQLHKIMTSHGYWWLGQLGLFGDSLYINEKLPNFEAMMVKYADKREKIKWVEQDHKYMAYPVWTPKATNTSN